MGKEAFVHMVAYSQQSHIGSLVVLWNQRYRYLWQWLLHQQLMLRPIHLMSRPA